MRRSVVPRQRSRGWGWCPWDRGAQGLTRSGGRGLHALCYSWACNKDLNSRVTEEERGQAGGKRPAGRLLHCLVTGLGGPHSGRGHVGYRAAGQEALRITRFSGVGQLVWGGSVTTELGDS